MTPRVMPLDMLKLCRLRPKRIVVPVQVSQPFVEGRVSRADVADVTLEVLDVDGVKADDGRVQADVGFCYLRAKVVGA